MILDTMTWPMQTPVMPDTFFTIAEIAKMLDLSRQRVHALIDERNIPTVRKGRTLIVHESHLSKFENREPGRPKKKVGRPRKTK